MECKLKIVLSDAHYIYAGYPHDDEEFQVSVWSGENRIPIGDVARTMHAAGDSYADRRTAISEKYGSDFAKKFEDAISVFNEEWWEEIDDDMEVYGRISACCRDDTEDKLRQLEELGIEVEDARSEKSKQIGRGISKLRILAGFGKGRGQLHHSGKVRGVKRRRRAAAHIQPPSARIRMRGRPLLHLARKQIDIS